MCGITGFIDFGHRGDTHTLECMADTLAHRGPDDRGIWLAEVGKAQIGLGHRRLSIIDLRPSSAQPMSFGELQIVFNGEIYNYRDIRERLIGLGHQFVTESDTEVLLHAYAQWGVKCVDFLIGMFAFVIVDGENSKVYFFRDRAGVKPLYIHQRNDLILFGSELKSLLAHPAFDPQIDVGSFSRYFDFGYVPSGQSIFQQTYKLQPATYLCVDLLTGASHSMTYWSINTFYQQDKLTLNYSAALDQLDELLDSACRYRMVSDVPVGLFLSGGYDSTSVLASLTSSQSSPIKAFTIGFETGNNELPQASKIAAFLGAEHHTYVCTETDARAIIPDLPYFYDEPFADSSAIPTILVSRFAREHVTVALSADGGDELFYGYTSYADLGRRLARLRHLPRAVRRWVASVIETASVLVPKSEIRKRHLLQGLASSLDADDKVMALRLYSSTRCLPRDYSLALFQGFQGAMIEQAFLSPHVEELIDTAANWDYVHYLVDDILTKVDRATMSASLEGREPLLDHRIAEFAARLPEAYKTGCGVQKRILKDLVHRRVPETIMAGPKRGFSIPVLKWLREDLSDLVDEHLSNAALAQSGCFKVHAVRKLVDDFMVSRLHYSPLIWKILMFQMWYARWMKRV